MMTRETLEYLPCTKLRDIRYVSIEWCDGLDSQAAAIRCIQAMCAIGYCQFIIFCNNSDDASVWYQKMAQMKMPKHRLDEIIIITYKNMHFYKDNIFDLIILDKLDEMTSVIDWELFGALYNRSVYNKPKVVSLSKPDLSISVKHKIEEFTGSSFTSYYTHNLAIMEGLLIKPKIHIVPLLLSRSERECKYEVERGVIDKRLHITVDYRDCQEYLDRDKYPNIDLTIMCSVNERYSIYSSSIEVQKQLAKSTQSKANVSKWLKLKNDRLSFICEQKKPFIHAFLTSKYMKKKNFVYIGGTIHECFQMGAEKVMTPKNHYNADIVRSFNTGELKNLFAAGNLENGINYDIADIIIISQLDRRFKQVMESLKFPLRKEDPDIFIFYCKDTRDEEYIASILKSIGKSHIDTMSPHEVCILQSTPESSEAED